MTSSMKHMAQDFFAGSCAGGFGILAGYPFDTIKVLIQNQTLPVRYTSTFQTMALVTREQGFRRLYRGLMTPMITVAFYNAFTFAAYEDALKRLDKMNYSQHVGLKHGTAGFFSGLVRSVIINPIEVIKVQLQVPRENPITAVECLRLVYQESGIRGFNRGYLCCLAREPLAFTCYFSSFEMMTSGRKNDNLVVLLAGGIAGILSWVPGYPADVIKTRLQGDGFGPERQYKGTWHCFKCTIAGDPGIRILYRGFGSCVYRAFVVNSAVLFVYTQLRNAFEKLRQIK